jgi:hypothetical protein
MSLNAGTRLGSYEVVAQIGAGGMGEVYQRAISCVPTKHFNQCFYPDRYPGTSIPHHLATKPRGC